MKQTCIAFGRVIDFGGKWTGSTGAIVGAGIYSERAIEREIPKYRKPL